MRIAFLSSALLALVLSIPTSARADEPTASPSGANRQRPLVIPTHLFEAGQGQGDWQARHDEAVARKKSGMKKVWIGLALEGGGLAIAVAGAGSCDTLNDALNGCTGSSAGVALGALTMAAGGVSVLWGAIQFIDAGADVRALEPSRPAARGASISFGDHQSMSVALGPRSTAAYGISW